ncbi:hypothetical protein MKZ38_004394 [Zalerion maritima]|uniref:Uncharacterized protein n=1 Tax=Zalerion maritima TaxID=339359 RepID=A0AAD5WRN2_9PEZI|nr:hypothetical protein MKZ38_004394 [Zalerion maritima]
MPTDTASVALGDVGEGALDPVQGGGSEGEDVTRGLVECRGGDGMPWEWTGAAAVERGSTSGGTRRKSVWRRTVLDEGAWGATEWPSDHNEKRKWTPRTTTFTRIT